MPVQTSYPGVYIQEVPSGVQTISGVSTSVAMFVGTTRRGRLGVVGSTPRFFPQRIRSYTEYVRIFGEDTDSETTDQVRQFFLNGGREAWVTRIADASAAAASVLLANEDGVNVLELTAKDAGVDGNLIRVEVDYNTVDPEVTFNMRVFRLEADVFGEFQVVADELFTELSMDGSDGRFVETVLNQQSVLVDAAVDGGAPAPGEGFSLSGILLAAADPAAMATLNGQLSGTANSITISVDGEAFVPAVLSTITAIGGGGEVDEWEQAINVALNPTGTEVDVALVAGPGTTRYLEIRSRNATGGSVVVRPGAVNDASAPLQLGTAQGGLEVSGFAELRPAQTGLFARLGGPSLSALNNLAGSTDAQIGDWELTDGTTNSPHPPAATPAFQTGGSEVYTGTASSVGEGSLLNVRENLRDFADSLNDNVDNQWRATLEGLRLVLRPRISSQLRPTVDAVNAGVGATLTTDGAGLDIGDDDEYFDSDATGVANANAAAYSLGTTGTGDYQSGGTNGAAGGVPDEGDYAEAYTVIDAEVDLFNLLILPRAHTQTDAQRDALWGPASVFCQAKRAFLIVDPRSSWRSADDVDGDIQGVRVGLTLDHAAIYWPRILLAADGGGTRSIDPAGSIAGVMARTDANRGVWKAPAGIEANLRGVRGVEHMMTDGENGTINLQAINAIRQFPSGIVSWGARTLVGFRSDDYKYVPVRRIALFIEESLYRGLRFAVFEPNDEPLWAQIRLAAGAFMNNLFRQGAFQGQKASDAYFVKVDSETTTQNDINLGIVNVVVGFAPLKPAEFVVVTIQQKAGQIQV